MTYDELFLETMADLKKKTSEGDEYNLIRACGLLRHLLLDSCCLVDIVRRTDKIKIQFEVHNYPADIDNKLEENVVLWVLPHPGRNNIKLSKDNFLKRIMVKTYNDSYSIKEIIQMTSHVKGGIHSGNPSAKDQVLIEIDQGSKFRNEVDAECIKGICEVVIAALKPLEENISARTSTSGLGSQSQ